MCGIIGYTGYLHAPEVLIQGLHELEYRGYDSAGIACFTKDGIQISKQVGKVSALEEIVGEAEGAYCGIGHTRWATHGGVTRENAHPHRHGRVTLIHNGIIENYHALEQELRAMGKEPISQTDTEIAAILMDSLYEGDPYTTIVESVKRLEGAYSFCILFDDQPETIYCVRKGSPLVACTFEDGTMVASDMVALLKYSKEYFVLPEYRIAKMTKSSITLTDMEGNPVLPEMLSVTWDMTAAQKGGYKHYMKKEIYEQPEALRRTIMPRFMTCVDATVPGKKYYVPDFAADGIEDSLFTDVSRIVITACGTAMHAGMIGKALFERLLRVPVEVEIASEFRYKDPILDANTLVITVSQSGETADTLAALRLARELGARTLSIVNVKGSSIARESDYVMYTHAGPEIAVASTKAYTAQLAAFYLLTFRFAYATGRMPLADCSASMHQLLSMISVVERTLTQAEEIKEVSRQLVPKEDLFFLGRGLDYALSWEASIKLKEITYIHSEAYAAGELKHGTLSLITDGVPVVAIATQKDVLAKMVSNIKEVKARGALVICIAGADCEIENGLCDYVIRIPQIDDLYAPYPAAVLLQMLAYYTSVYRGLDVDQPRNLAKSVTVE